MSRENLVWLIHKIRSMKQALVLYKVIYSKDAYVSEKAAERTPYKDAAHA